MKRISLVILLLTFAALGFAQSQQTTPPPAAQPAAPQTAASSQQAGAAKPISQSLAWLVGNWQGQGTENGQNFVSQLNVTVELGGQGLLLRRTSQGGYSEIMMIGFDKTSNKTVATLFNSVNNAGIFIGTLANNSITLAEASNKPGFVSNRIFTMVDPSTITFALEASTNPGEPVKRLLEMTYKKQP